MKDGEYCSIGRIAKKEGGGLHGMQLAFKYCTNAIILGGMWVKWDDMTESIKFLYFTHRMSETFKEAWEELESWSTRRPGGDDDADRGGGAIKDKKRSKALPDADDEGNASSSDASSSDDQEEAEEED
eukprot:9487928-Pyramimonas_sp.AAC.1